MGIQIIRKKISKTELIRIAKEVFGDMAKAVVDIEREIMTVGGSLHADGEAILLEDGSKQENLWGINLYPEKPGNEWIEFHSMVNIRPNQGNRSMEVENPKLQVQIKEIIGKLVV